MTLRLRHILLTLLLLVPVHATAARRDASVVVEVRDPDGRPVAGATVTVDEEEACQTGPDGRCTVSELRPGRAVALEVSKPGSAWAPAAFPALEVEEGEATLEVSLERSRAARRLSSELTIIATDPEGRPVSRAVVTIDGLKKGKTDGHGTLLYAGRRAGATIVLGIASLRGDLKLSVVTTVDLLGGPQVTRVTLEPEEEPEVAAVAEAEPEPEPPPAPDPRRVDSDGDGRPDRRDQCPDEAEVFNRYRDNDGCPDALATLVIWVMDPDGDPVEGATITLNGAEAGNTGTDGSFSVAELRPGSSVRPGITAPMMFPVALERMRLEEGRQAHTIVLTPMDTDGDGRPDRVDACPAEGETFNQFRDEDGCPDALGVLSVLVLDPDGDPVTEALVMVDESEAGRTGADGRVLVTGMMPGTRVAVRADKPDPMLAPGGIGAVDLRTGAQSVTLSLQRSPEALLLAPELNILVQEPPYGKPVPWAMVYVDGLPKGRTDRSGAYRYVGRTAGTTLIVAVGEPRADREISTMKSIHLDGGPQRLRMWMGGGDGGVGDVSTRDGDGDGTVDTYDGCPNEQEVVNGYLDGDGCPDELATVVLGV
ncbi:MAG: carboxypeptidase regulatory-like domain-containing protein, partial [Deltaproteobacteria bacterium]|nr:carboxypeptidase regulatory-like domain-containing protein [Deltaproteobacteria bacterium]